MLDDLQQIDTSAIEQLVRIKEEQTVLNSRLQKMDENKSSVSNVVYQRVRGDYETRLSALDNEARPLKDHARREYAKLRTLQLGMEKALEDARLGREELEFRNSLGEFEAGEFDEKLGEANDVLNERQSHLDEAIELKARFLTAVKSEEELTSGTAEPLPPPRPRTAAAAPVPPPEVLPDDATAIAMRSSAPAPALALDEPVLEEQHHDVFAASDSTAVSWFSEPAHAQQEVPTDLYATPPRTEESPSIAPPGQFGMGPSGTAPGFGAPGEYAPDATQVAPISAFAQSLPTPRMIALVGDAHGQEYILRPGTTSIGRSPKAQIRVIEESVSRQHAQIILGPEGCKIVDLGSENGTNINGRRVNEHVLADGDLIQIGTHRFLFRA